jgi:hypothetical protein
MGFERLLKPGKDKVETVPPGISRRTFLVTGAAAGGGLLLGFYVPARIEHSRTRRTSPLSERRPSASTRLTR